MKDLWGTSSTTLTEKSEVTNKPVNTSRFELHLLNSSKNQLEENRNSADELKVGDLLCRKKNYKNQVDGHVEFYIGKAQPYSAIIRFIGGGDDKK